LDPGALRATVSMTVMSDARVNDGVASLYRRFRPQTFAELRGQEHVVRALQGAVANDRVVHAYLFSGPRGTGKTTTARILAKALNCESPVDGDACDVCASCVAITRGASLDVVEIDAASHNGVDNMRALTDSAWQSAAGRWKVFILDEVHQLSKSASAALLKTLEEPPSRVVFVLATTDPHKVLPTLRSRTQHLEFRLLPADTLHDLLADVTSKAGLDTSDDAVDAAVRLGRGSARDALSALDRLVATGQIESDRPPFDGLLAGLLQRDAAATLGALATLLGDGWETEQVAIDLAAAVRQAFLLQVAPDLADVTGTERDTLANWGRESGLPTTVRTLETLGEVLRDMKSAPAPLALFEVALVRLVRPDLDRSLDALAQRVTDLERSGPRVSAPDPAPAAPTLRPIGSVAPSPTPTPVADEAPVAQTPPADPAPRAEAPALDEFVRRFESSVVPRTSRATQFVLKAARVRSVEQGAVTFAVPSDDLRQSGENYDALLRKALEFEFKTPMKVAWVVDGSVPVPTAPPSATLSKARPAPTVEDVVSDGEADSDDATTIVVDSAGEHLITELFPGAEELS